MKKLRFLIFLIALIGIASCGSKNIKENQKRNFLMLKAAQNGNLSLLKSCLKQGANINAVDKYNNTALIWAAKNQHSEIIAYLIKERADLDFFNDKDRSLAQLKEDYYKTLFNQMINEDGSRRNLLSADKFSYYQESVNHGKTALIYAVKNNDLLSASLLINAGAKLDLSDKDHKTALIYAVLNQNFTLVQALLEANADLSIKSKINPSFLTANTALSYAVFLNHIELTLLILSKMQTNNQAFFNDKANAFKIASYKNYSHLQNIFIQDYKNKASKIVFESIKNAFLLACKKKNKKTVKMILAQAVLDKGSLEQGLFKACEGGALEIVKLLFKQGLTVFTQNKKGQTPLMVSAQFGHLALVKFFVKKGSKINRVDHYYDSALDLSKSIAVIHYLLSVGAKRGKKPKGYHRSSSFGETAGKIISTAIKVVFFMVYAALLIASSSGDNSKKKHHRRRRHHHRRNDKKSRKARKDAYHKKYGPAYH